MRILEVSNPKDLRKIMQEIGVNPYGIKIMLPKAITHLLRLNSISSIAANILKQQMLSLGGDVAVARDVLTGKAKKTDCLMLGNLTQFNRLKEKLNRQPFGLNKLAQELSCALNNYQRDSFTIDLGRFVLRLASRTHIMGIVNLTPDSFSQDGLYSSSLIPHPSSLEGIIKFAEKLVQDGADIVDVGGESSRPGAKPVTVREELNRTIPVIKKLARKIKIPISIDTYKPEVARQALDNGAVLVNDITGLRNSEMAKIIARYKAGAVIMHMKGKPQTMQNNPVYKSLIDEIIGYLNRAIQRAIIAGVDEKKIIIDPGIGFGKTVKHNLEILKRLREIKILGKPILIGPSRKSFIGKILNAPYAERVFGTVSACVLAARNGANIVRVHDVKEIKQSLKVLDAINNRC